MRVLVYGLSSDKLGGIETFLLNMNRFMSDDMIFDYVVEGTGTIHQAAIQEKGGKVYFISPKRNMLQNIRDWQKVLKEYRKTSRVIYFNMFSLAWSVPIYIAQKYGYRVIVHAHNNNLHNCGVVLKTLHAINRGLLNLSGIIRLTNSKLSTEFFFGNKPAEMIYNAIDVDRFSFDSKRRIEIREKLKAEDKNIYGFSGRIAYQKNPLFLIDIFCEIKKLDKKAIFLVCGDGDLMPEVKEKALGLGKDIVFTGNVLKIEEYYQAMDCFILPSRFEGLGIVLIEAQCSGLPCITSDVVIPKDAKVTELLTFIELKDNPEEWAKKAVSSCKTIWEPRNHYAKQIAETQFNIVTESVRLEKILKDVN